MHYARLKNSPRLKRVLEFLKDHKKHTTRDIVYGAYVCAVNSCISELRANGYDISCISKTDDTDRRIWEYRLIKKISKKS